MNHDDRDDSDDDEDSDFDGEAQKDELQCQGNPIASSDCFLLALAEAPVAFLSFLISTNSINTVIRSKLIRVSFLGKPRKV